MKLTVKLPNFTLTRGKVPGKEGGGGGGGLRKLRRNLRQIFLWGLLGLLFFLVFAWISLPTRALAWRISHEAKVHGYLVDIEDISISPFGGITLENVRWTYEPSRPDQIPMSFEVPEVEIDVSVLSLLVGNIDVDLLIELDEGNDGTIRASYARGAEESSFSLEIADMPLYRVPKAVQALNAPLKGILAIKVDLTMPQHKFSDATGAIELTCAACTVGDGAEKLYVPGSKSLKSGVVIPEIDMGTLAGRMTVEGGVATTDGPIETKSEDVWIHLSGSINFKDPFAKSRIAMELKFNLSEKLQSESEPMRFMIQTANPKSQLDAPEKGLGFRLEGPLGKPRFIPIKSKSRRQARLDKRQQQRERDEQRRKTRAQRSTPPKVPGADQEPKIGEPLDVEPLDPSQNPALPPPREMPPPGTYEPSSDPPTTEEPQGEEPQAGDEGGGEEPQAEEPQGEEPQAGDEGGGEERPAEEDQNQPGDDGTQVEGEGGEGGAPEGGEAAEQ
ncbi:MAG: type II secretion system protein GspN [Myxococcales bacterium]|nr:type II secretion system protein GspN [Myxococcales bacterium]